MPEINCLCGQCYIHIVFTYIFLYYIFIKIIFVFSLNNKKADFFLAIIGSSVKNNQKMLSPKFWITVGEGNIVSVNTASALIAVYTRM
jgi:hypothetical protein